ncbi:hypothetical protein CRUP_005987, partial [Coryphaenoides rupestris]
VVTCPNASFTDLAEIVSRIEPVKNAPIDEEYSDDYQTDYEEEDAAGSALSDYELSYLASELTEGEETADTAETVRFQHNLGRVVCGGGFDSQLQDSGFEIPMPSLPVNSLWARCPNPNQLLND